jgi:redox-sensitive bicupin YhaK (pirin superfamily)
MTSNRTIREIIASHPTSDGDGVKIRRVHGFDNPKFSPFLMIDELKSDDKKDYIGGFPPHPHRGIETLTYMIQGHFQHRDHMGNVSELRSGGAQWMAAGRGVIHSEMPIMDSGQLHGFQIWINQPAKNKMKPAQHHDFQPESITEYQMSGCGLVRLLAGSLTIDNKMITGPLTNTGVAVTVADWRAQKGEQLNLRTPEHHNVLVYTYQGELLIGEKMLIKGELALVSMGEAMEIHAREETGALIFVGEPINEPIVHYGPFVMNSSEEIQRAIDDYNRGEFEHY